MDIERRERRGRSPPREARGRKERSHREKSGRELGLVLQFHPSFMTHADKIDLIEHTF